MTKHRILQFINERGMVKSSFFKKTGLKRGFLDSDKLSQTVSDKNLEAILRAFPELNIEWLITGDGDMLKTSNPSIPHDYVSIERYDAKVEECAILRMKLNQLTTT